MEEGFAKKASDLRLQVKKKKKKGRYLHDRRRFPEAGFFFS